MKYLALGVIVWTTCLCGCATTNAPNAAYAPPQDVATSEVASDEVDVQPPLPSFSSATDCEQAYGPGACGTGAAVYERAGLVVPQDSYNFFVPYAFGVMTGVLINHFFAPPTVFVAGYPYRTFVSPTAVNNYKIVNQTTVNNYYAAPAGVRAQALRQGPVRFSRSTGRVTGPARFAAVKRGDAGVAPRANAPRGPSWGNSNASNRSTTQAAHTPVRSYATNNATLTGARQTTTSGSSGYGTSATTTSKPAQTYMSAPRTNTAVPPSHPAPASYTPPRTAAKSAAASTSTARICKTYPCP